MVTFELDPRYPMANKVEVNGIYIMNYESLVRFHFSRYANCDGAMSELALT